MHPSFGPYAYVIPKDQIDPLETVRLVTILYDAGVEVHQATAAFEADGKSYAAGSYIVPLDQPYRGFAKTVLERKTTRISASIPVDRRNGPMTSRRRPCRCCWA